MKESGNYREEDAMKKGVQKYENHVYHGSKILRLVRSFVGGHPFTWYRHMCNIIVTPFLKKPVLTTTLYKDGMRFWDHVSYKKALTYYLAKRQTFEEYVTDPTNELKEYIDLDFSVYFQVYKNKPATVAALKSFRQFYPSIPILLVCDGGDDFTDIAREFNCEYYHDPENLGYWPCKDIGRWFKRVARACEMFNTEWVLILENDVRTRDRISKYPHAHLAGPGGGRGARKQLSPAAQRLIRERYLEAEFSGTSGSGGSIFHNASYMKCLANIRPGDIQKWLDLDIAFEASDIALSFLFLLNGYVVRRWLDLSEDFIGNYGPGSAIDHQYKEYYKKRLITFSLFGNNELYCKGAVENARLAKEIYPDWVARFYVADDVPPQYVEQIKSYGAEVILCKRKGPYDGLHWRFRPLMEADVGAWISRDCDSRLNWREKAAVDEWLQTDKSLHIMRDAHNHGYPIMAGMFGINNTLFHRRYGKVCLENSFSRSRGDDQSLLERKIWKKTINDHLCHDHWHNNNPTGQPTTKVGDHVSADQAYGVGLLKYVTTASLKPRISYPTGQDNRPFPPHKPIEYGLYVGQRIDENNKVILNTDTRWEYELRKTPYPYQGRPYN